MFSKRLFFIAILSLFVLAGCEQGKKVPDAPPPAASSPPAQAGQQSPYGSSADVPSSAPRAEMLAFVDADRGSDFVAHGAIKLPSADPVGRWVGSEFDTVVPETEEMAKKLKESVGKTVWLSGRWDADRRTFAASGIDSPPREIAPSEKWIGWGLFSSLERGELFRCGEPAALTDWVKNLRLIAGVLSVPANGISDLDKYFRDLERLGQIGEIKYVLNQKFFKTEFFVTSGESASAGLRGDVGKTAFLVSGEIYGDPHHRVLVRKADVSEDDVSRFMEAARSVPCGGEGPHAEAPATIFGYAFRPPKSEIVYVCGVEGDSFSEWMRIFRSGAGSGVTWKAAGVPEELVSKGEEKVFCWFAGQRTQDPLTKQWYFKVNSAVTEKQYESSIAILKNLSL